MIYHSKLKRLIDIIFSSILFFILSPIFYFIILFIKLDSDGPAFFKQKRIGRNFKSFQIIKFRSMFELWNGGHEEFNPGDNRRVTRIGSFLRKTKLDELPELFNVLNGDMSIVGPRPEVEKYVNAYIKDFKKILSVTPGLSDYASIKYRDEEEILGKQKDPQHHYLNVILPDKLRLTKRYLREISFKTDMRIIKNTITSIVKREK